MHFASETSKHAKLTGGEPTNIPYAATKAKPSLSMRSLLAGFRIRSLHAQSLLLSLRGAQRRGNLS
jgi:hypothetical protein